MDLREYMFRYRITYAQMAELLDCSKPQVSLAKNGRPVSKKFARQIEAATNGMVKREEIVTSGPIIPFPKPEPETEEEPIERSA